MSTINSIVSFLPPAYQPLALSVIGVVGAAGVLVKAIDVPLQLAHGRFPNNKTVAVLEHWFSYIAPRWPSTMFPPPTPVVGSPVVPKGYLKTGMGLFLAAGAAVGIACASCAHLTPLETSLLNCGESALAQVATSAGPQVLVILQGGSPNWASQLTSLVGSLGNGVICAVNAIVSSLTAKAPADLAPVDQLTIVRAQAWLDLQSVKVAPVAAERH